MAHYGTGPSGYTLATDGLKQIWQSGVSLPAGLTEGDLVVTDSAGNLVALPSGDEGDVLSISAGSVAWNASSTSSTQDASNILANRVFGV